ncbi:MAG TPA: hypothetical protein VF412_18120 [Bdellovibrio sp.]|uniref:beta strand repeat-containing protein n=1 Tax=Bdellovibrio sp. TaxID=28201 RepID=UPI002EE84D56
MRTWNFLSVLVFLFSFGASVAEASPASLSYQGKITKTDGTDLEYNNVSFIFKVTNAAGTCIIYQEQVSGYDMTNSKGVFDVPIGSGSVTYPSDGSLTILDSFNNSRTFTCSGGSTYAAASGDSRKLRVMFFDGVGWQTLSPDLTVRSVPYSAFAYSAEKLGTYNSTDFLLKAIMPVTSCPSGNFLTYDGTNIVCSPVSTTSGTVTAVTSTNSYLSVATGTTTPALTLNVGTTANTVAAGNDSRITGALQSGSTAGGDLSGTYPNPSVAKIQGVAVSATAPTSGQVLTFNGTIWAPATASGGGGSGTITDVIAGTGLTGGGSSGSVTLDLANTSVTAGSYTRANITVDAQGRLTAASNGSAVNLASDVTGTLPIANGGTGQTTKTTAYNALSPLTTKGDLVVSDGTNNVRLAVGTDGQYLSADSTQTGGLKWVTPSTGTVSNVSGTSPVVVTSGSTTPTISVNTATTSGLGVVQIGSGIAVSSGTISADPANFPSAVPVSKGGTGGTSLTANSLLMSNGTGTGLTALSCSTGQIVGFNASGIAGCYNANTIGYFANGGNAFGAAASLGTTDSNSLTLLTNNTARITVASSGNVGIGTTNPGATFHVLGSAAFENNSNTVSGPNFSFWKNRAYTATQNLDELGYISFYGHDGSSSQRAAFIVSKGDGTPSSGSVPGSLGFFTTNSGASDSTEKMHISANGTVGIGTSSPSYTLDMGSNSDGMRLPAGTTAQQPTSSAGVMRFNQDTNAMEYNDGSAWIPVKNKYNATVFTTSQTLAAGDGYQTLNFTPSANSTVTLPSTTGLPVGWWVILANNSSTRGLTAQTSDGTLFDASAATFSIPKNGNNYKLTWKGATWSPSYVSGNGFYGPAAKGLFFNTTATTASAGNLGFTVGNSVEGPGSVININSGSGGSQTTNTYNGGDININAGFGINNGNGGNITLMAGQSNNGGGGSGNAGTISLYGGLNSSAHGAIMLNPTGGGVSIGLGTPSATLDVNGTIKSVAVSNTSTAIDFSTGNLQYTSSSCGTFNLNNMKSGASYTLAVQGTAGGTCAFNAYSDAGTTALTVKAGSVSLVQTAGKHTLFSFLVMGTYVYIAAIDGY